MMVKQLLSAIQKDPDRIVMEDGSPCSMTAGQFEDAVRRSASFWNTYFLSKGHHVGIAADNSVMWFVQAMGIIASGNVAVAYNFNYSDEDMLEQAELTDTEVMLCGEDEIGAFAACRKRVPFLTFSEAFGDTPGEVEERKPDDLVFLLFSSGTAGDGIKAVMLTNGNITAQCPYLLATPSVGEGVLIPHPMYHIAGLMITYRQLIRGDRIVVSTPKDMLRDIRRFGPSSVCGVPGMVQSVLKRPELMYRADGSQKLRKFFCSGALLQKEVRQELHERHIEIENVYGMTETAGAVSSYPCRDGSCGMPEPQNEVRIENGEIWIRGGNVMPGYYHNDEATKRILRNGWLCTGDMGRLDEDGYLYVTGRKKNVIVLSNGENVCPEELEEKLYQCPQITECRVYGADDMLCAQIYSADKETVSSVKERVIRAWVSRLNRELPTTHRIVRLDIRDTELEKTATGKIKRTRMEACEEKV